MTLKIAALAISIVVVSGIVAAACIAEPVNSNQATAAQNAPVTAGAQVAPSAQDPPQPPGAAAIVDGVTITLDEVKDRAFQSASRKSVQALIDNMLIDQAAKKAGIVVTDAEVEAETDFIRKSIAPQSLADGLKEHDLTRELFDDVRRHNIELDKLALIGVKPVKMAHVRQIFVHFSTNGGAIDAVPGPARTQSQALAVVKKIQVALKAGHKFEDLAKRYDEDPSTKDKGGDAGVVYDGAATDPTFNLAAVALKNKGDVTPTPVKSDDGYRLVQLVSTSDAHEPGENPLYDDATGLWKRQQANLRIHGVLLDLRSKAKIVNWLDH